MCGDCESCESLTVGPGDNRVTWNKNRILMGVITSANGSGEPQTAWVTTMARGDTGGASANQRRAWGVWTNERRGLGPSLTTALRPWLRVMAPACTLARARGWGQSHERGAHGEHCAPWGHSVGHRMWSREGVTGQRVG